MKKFICFVIFSFSSLLFGAPINPHGYWESEEDAFCFAPFDPIYAMYLVDFFKNEGARTVGDFGCGSGEYVKTLLEHQIACEGYDGNPCTPQITGGLAQVADLGQPLYLGKTFDWILCLEVGEHIPKEYEQIFIDNLNRHNTKGIILSWAVPGQGGHGHFNEQPNQYIKNILRRLGYFNDVAAEKIMREKASLPWFKNTLMVFRKGVKK